MSDIFIRTNFVGIHFWKDAPEEVAFLRHPHRHVFNIDAKLEVKHDDRELEFFMVREEIDSFIAMRFLPYHLRMPHLKMVGPMSCEMIAQEIQRALVARYGERKVAVRARRGEAPQGDHPDHQAQRPHRRRRDAPA